MRQREIGELTGQSQSEVSEILSGERVVQSYDLLIKIADGLRVPRGWMGLAYAGERPPAQPAPPEEAVDEDVKRRNFLAAASMALWGHTVLGELLEVPGRPAAPTPLPSRLAGSDVDALEALTARLRGLTRQFGGQAGTVSTIADRSTELARVPASDVVRVRLGSALADLHTMVGWCCYDSALPDHARHHFARAMDHASVVDDGYAAADAIRHAGMMMSSSGHPNDALKLYQLGQIRLDGDPRYTISQGTAPLVRSWLRAHSATALAAMDRPADARSELARARENWQPPAAFETADMDWVSSVMFQRIGDLTAAESFAASASRTFGSARREGALVDVHLALLHLQASEPSAPVLARRAIDEVMALDSARARASLVPLGRALAARKDSTCQDLARRVRQLC